MGLFASLMSSPPTGGCLENTDFKNISQNNL